MPWHFVYKFSNIPAKRGSPQEGKPYIRKHGRKVWFWMPIDLNLFTQCNSINFVSLALWYRPFSLLLLAFLLCATYSKSANRRAVESVREISDDLIIVDSGIKSEDNAEIGKYPVLPQSILNCYSMQLSNVSKFTSNRDRREICGSSFLVV